MSKIKDFFKRGKKEEEQQNPYLGGPISNGNVYEKHQEQLVRDQMARENTPTNEQKRTGENINQALTRATNKVWTNLTINEWTLLKLNSDYFINMIKFKTNDLHLTRTIQKLIKASFIYGKSALYIKQVMGSNTQFRVVIPTKIEQDLYGNSTKIEIINFSETMLSNGYVVPENLKPSEVITDQEDIENIIIFNWGINSIDSFQRMLPFVKYQSELLNMIVSASYGFIKKFDLVYNGKADELEELITLFFSSKNPFNIKYSNIDMSSKIIPVQNGHSENTNSYVQALLDFYKESTSIMYGLNGKRSNQDNKRERNVTAEVEASQSQFDNLEYNILNEFYLFTEEFNKNEKKGNFNIEFNWLSDNNQDKQPVTSDEPSNNDRDPDIVKNNK